MQYKPLWLINVRHKYAQCCFRCGDYCDINFNCCCGFAKDFSCSVAVSFWGFEYTRTWHRVVIVAMVRVKCRNVYVHVIFWILHLRTFEIQGMAPNFVNPIVRMCLIGPSLLLRDKDNDGVFWNIQTVSKCRNSYVITPPPPPPTWTKDSGASKGETSSRRRHKWMLRKINN
jgi:hypothetical protein